MAYQEKIHFLLDLCFSASPVERDGGERRGGEFAAVGPQDCGGRQSAADSDYDSAGGSLRACALVSGILSTTGS
jgi:hypothetical protein